jgi:hypothetical protein
MNVVDKAIETQLKNIQTRTGKSLEELYAILQQSGLAKHGELRDRLKKDLGMGHGDANTVVHMYLKSAAGGAAAAPGAASATGTAGVEVLDGIYTGGKAHLRPIHERLMGAIEKFGEFEIAPKKGYVSLRRKKQFAMIGPATQTRVEVGLNMKGVPGTERLQALPPGGMCQYKVHVSDAAQVDAELIAWIKTAYDTAG